MHEHALLCLKQMFYRMQLRVSKVHVAWRQQGIANMPTLPNFPWAYPVLVTTPRHVQTATVHGMNIAAVLELDKFGCRGGFMVHRRSL